MRELNEMTIGRTDDPENPFRATALEAALLFGAGLRNPSGPADMLPRRQGRTHDRNRPSRQNSHFSSCIRGAVHTWHGGTSAPAYLHAIRHPPPTLADKAITRCRDMVQVRLSQPVPVPSIDTVRVAPDTL